MSKEKKLIASILEKIDSYFEDSPEDINLNRSLIIDEVTKVVELYEQGLISQDQLQDLVNTNMKSKLMVDLSAQAISKVKTEKFVSNLIETIIETTNLMVDCIDPDDPWPRE